MAATGDRYELGDGLEPQIVGGWNVERPDRATTENKSYGDPVAPSEGVLGINHPADDEFPLLAARRRHEQLRWNETVPIDATPDRPIPP